VPATAAALWLGLWLSLLLVSRWYDTFPDGVRACQSQIHRDAAAAGGGAGAQQLLGKLDETGRGPVWPSAGQPPCGVEAEADVLLSLLATTDTAGRQAQHRRGGAAAAAAAAAAAEGRLILPASFGVLRTASQLVLFLALYLTLCLNFVVGTLLGVLVLPWHSLTLPSVHGYLDQEGDCQSCATPCTPAVQPTLLLLLLLRARTRPLSMHAGGVHGLSLASPPLPGVVLCCHVLTVASIWLAGRKGVLTCCCRRRREGGAPQAGTASSDSQSQPPPPPPSRPRSSALRRAWLASTAALHCALSPPVLLVAAAGFWGGAAPACRMLGVQLHLAASCGTPALPFVRCSWPRCPLCCLPACLPACLEAAPGPPGPRVKPAALTCLTDPPPTPPDKPPQLLLTYTPLHALTTKLSWDRRALLCGSSWDDHGHAHDAPSKKKED
jgi:hypothetical protein